MSFFKKLKKVFKTIANIVTAPLKAVVTATASVAASAMKLVASVEALIYDGLKQVTDALTVGPSWIRNLAGKLNGFAYDTAMFASRLKLGLGLLALGAATNNKGMRTEGRLELLTAVMYFTRATGYIPQWLMMIVMIFLSFFFPIIALIILAVFLVVYAVTKYEIPKLGDDPDLLIQHLLMLMKYGLLDKETSALLQNYLDKVRQGQYPDETAAGPFGPGHTWTDFDPTPILDNIRDILKDNDVKDQTPFDPGQTTPPIADLVSSPMFTPTQQVLIAGILGALILRTLQ